jgi:hypothetical protein
VTGNSHLRSDRSDSGEGLFGKCSVWRLRPNRKPTVSNYANDILPDFALVTNRLMQVHPMVKEESEWIESRSAAGEDQEYENVQRMTEREPVRIPKDVLEDLEAVRRYTRVEVLDVPTLSSRRWRGASAPWLCG